MSRQYQGKAHCYDGVLDVDWEISPLEDAHFLIDAADQRLSDHDQARHLAAHCLAEIDPDFAASVQPGDFLVGHRGVGWGHGHDQAVLAIKAVGIAAVICETTTVTFKRNCIHHGLPIVEIPDVFCQIRTGDRLALDLDTGFLKNSSTGKTFQFGTYPEFLLDIIDAGGVYPQMGRQLSQQKEILL
jgi:3-isopropylmalate/(R)-2-methylmalate dehydratase small subunit